MPCSPQAAYLQQAGLRTAVLEKRHVLGGAAVTEEIVPGTPMSLVPLAPASPGGRHSPPPHIFQGSGSPGHHICSACCDHKSMLIWSCRYWHPPFSGLLATPTMQAGGPCCQAVPAVGASLSCSGTV